MEKIYKEIYKCRLCGALFEVDTENPMESYAAESRVSLLCSGHSLGTITNSPRLYHAHACDDGSFGLSDFQGIKKIGVSK